MDLLERFLKYVSISTSSNSESLTVPSTKTQFDLAKVLIEELKVLGLEVEFDEEHCIVYAKLKGNVEAPSIGFLSHLDTSEDAPGENIKPQIIKNYDGNDIILGNNRLIKVNSKPDLKNHVGKTLITSDGTTLLGADDKAGIAEIMAMLDYITHNNEDHGSIYIAFTSDEEIGKSVDYLDLNKFKPDFAYSVDGSSLGEITYENFNAARIKISIDGIPVHLGYAKDKLVSSLELAHLIHSSVPHEFPENTEKREGYYHLHKITGDINHTEMEYIIRDFTKEGFKKRKDILTEIVDLVNMHYGNLVSIEITDSYYNMYDYIKKDMYPVTLAQGIITSLGITPTTQ